MQKHIWWVGAVVVAIAAIVLFFSWRSSRHPGTAAGPATVVAPPAAAPAIQNPVPSTSGTVQPLPPLESSDGPLLDALSELMGKHTVENLLKPEQLVRHFVVTVDNMSRKKVALELRPTKSVAGTFMASGDEQHSTLDPANYQRYAPMVLAIQTVDAKQLASLYFHFYPLFQQSYQNLGYPNGYFNDRLVLTIDNLLATPDISGDIVLVRPNVMYQFADPNLEDLSAGQKALLRMGPTNAAIVKAKLRELRAQIASVPHTP